MALWVCQECGTKYAVGLSRCPRCHSTDFVEDGVMPKITAHGGPSVASATEDASTSTPPTPDQPGTGPTPESQDPGSQPAPEPEDAKNPEPDPAPPPTEDAPGGTDSAPEEEAPEQPKSSTIRRRR